MDKETEKDPAMSVSGIFHEWSTWTEIGYPKLERGDRVCSACFARESLPMIEQKADCPGPNSDGIQFKERGQQRQEELRQRR